MQRGPDSYTGTFHGSVGCLVDKRYLWGVKITYRNPTAANSRKGLAFVLVAVCLDTTGLGIIYPIVPQLIRELVGAGIGGAAAYGGWLTFTYALMQFIFAPILGNLSDAFGRRPVLLSSIFGFGIDCLFLAFAPTITWLFAGRFIAGITGASYSVASATIADISDDDTRTRNFGYINAAYSAGFIIGPALGGVLGQFGTHVPFLVAGFCCLANFVFGWFYFPESLAPGRRRKFDWKKINPLAGLKKMGDSPRPLRLLFALFFITVASHSMPSVWAYFTMERFDWNTATIGYSLAFIGAMSVVVQSSLVGPVTRFWGEYRMTLVGILLSLSGLLGIAFSVNLWTLFPALVFYVMGSIQRAGFQSMASRSVPMDEQGALQGTIAGLSGLATIVAPPLMTQVFNVSAGHTGGMPYFPGASYLLAGLLTAVSLALLCWYRDKVR